LAPNLVGSLWVGLNDIVMMNVDQPTLQRGVVVMSWSH
jgi:hypothetical protein